MVVVLLGTCEEVGCGYGKARAVVRCWAGQGRRSDVEFHGEEQSGDVAVPGSRFLGLRAARRAGFCSGRAQPHFFPPVKFWALT